MALDLMRLGLLPFKLLAWVPLFKLRPLSAPPATLMERLFHNRRNYLARHFFVADVIQNVSDEWYCFVNRLPPGSWIQKADGDRLHSTRSL
jgi:hypothetical protein